MSIATVRLRFDLNDPDDRNEHKRMLNATAAYITLHEIGEQIFRPARKHGYDDRELEKLIAACPCVKEDGSISNEDDIDAYNAGAEIVSKLEATFYEILKDNGINLDDRN